MPSSYKGDGMDDEPRGLIANTKNLILTPFRIALSKPALRAYLTTILAIITGLFLLATALAAYTAFYWSYIPRLGLERTIHLQFDNVYYQTGPDQRQYLGIARDASPYPYGTVDIAPDIVSNQAYDIKIDLELPRTPDNTGAGNFMLDVALLSSKGVLDTVKEAVKDGLAPGLAEATPTLARSRRPAILKYRSWPVEYLHRLTELHWYMLGFRNEAETLSISMFEKVSFAKGWRNVPSCLRLEIQSAKQMQIYSAKALFRARFTGLRWLMYNHRIISATVFVTTFWTTEMIFAGLAWAALSFFFFAPAPSDMKAEEVHEVAQRAKAEHDCDENAYLSDTERTFPTLTGQQRLRYQSPEVKKEEDDTAMPLDEVPPTGVEADDEDEEADFIDSGLGTSLESSGSRPGSVRKRRGRPSFKDGL